MSVCIHIYQRIYIFENPDATLSATLYVMFVYKIFIYKERDFKELAPVTVEAVQDWQCRLASRRPREELNCSSKPKSVYLAEFLSLGKVSLFTIKAFT